MGGAASTSKDDNTGVEVVNLFHAHKGMRLFQHKITGEIIVLFNDDMESYIGPQAKGLYDEATLSRQQGDYLKQLKVRIAVPAANAVHASVMEEKETDTVERIVPPTPAKPDSNTVPPSAPQDDIVRKRLSNLRDVATGEKEATSDSYGYADSGMAEPKNSSPGDRRRKFVPQPFFPPDVYKQDSKLVEEWQSLSEFPSMGAKESRAYNTGQANSNSEKDSSGLQQSLRNGRAQCPHCGDKYFGSQAAQMLADHVSHCQADEELRKQLWEVDVTLQGVFTHFDRGSRGALEGIVEEALCLAADEMDALKDTQDRVKRLIKRCLSLQAANADERYAQKLRL
eukprot:gene40264-49063_t